MFLILLTTLPVIAGCISYRFGYIAGQCHEHIEASMAGVGEWNIDPEDCVYRFRYGVRSLSNHLADDEQAPWV